jgi:hypothetical protein
MNEILYGVDVIFWILIPAYPPLKVKIPNSSQPPHEDKSVRFK